MASDAALAALATYDGDFYAWLNEQAGLLRAGRFSEVDIENVAEELETLGRSQRAELHSGLETLVQHLLKWQFQPGFRGNSWRLTIEVQRRDLGRHLRENPSLKSHRHEALIEAYVGAVLLAARESGYHRDYFPRACPYSYEEVMDDAFWPEFPP